MKIDPPQRFISTALLICGALLLMASFSYFQLIRVPNPSYLPSDIAARQGAKGEAFLIGALLESSQLNMYLSWGIVVGLIFIALGFYARFVETRNFEATLQKITKESKNQIDYSST